MKIITNQRLTKLFTHERLKKTNKSLKFSFKKSLELTKNCKSSLSNVVINERRNEKW